MKNFPKPAWIHFQLFFVVISAFHFVAVYMKSYLYGYSPSPDSYRYLQVASEFLGQSHLSAEYNCYTSPGYPLFLALLKLVHADSITVIGVVQSLIFCFSVYRLIRILVSGGYFTIKHAFISVSLLMIAPDLISLNRAILTESLTSSLLLIIASFLFERHLSPTRLVILSMLTGLLVLVKLEYIFIVPVIIFLLYRNGNKLLYISAPIIAVMLILTANGFRNKYIYDRFTFTSFSGGLVIYGGNNANGDGSFRHYPEFDNYIPPQYLAEIDCSDENDDVCICLETDAAFKRAAADAWLENPVLQLRIIPLKFLKLWVLPADFDPYSFRTEFVPDLYLSDYFRADNSFFRNIKNSKYIIIYWLLLIISLTGIFVRIYQRGISGFDMYAISVIIIISMAYSIPFYGLPRFHTPLIPLLYIYGTFSFFYVWNKLSGGNKRLH